MARPSNALKRFAELYVNGPEHIRGRWDLCANGAGMKEIPDRDDVMVRRMVEEAGGVVVPIDPPEHNPLAGLVDLELAADLGIPWKEIRGQLVQTIRSVATGELKASAAQVAMLKEIIKKAEEQNAEEEEIRSVVVLPTQGSAAEMKIDEKWMKRIQEMETKADAEV